MNGSPEACKRIQATPSGTNGRTPLMEACWIGDYEKVSRLVLEGADVNAQNTNGTTALMYAKTYTFATGDTRIITLLLRSGADAATKDNFGKTASDYTRERADLVLTLLDPTKIHSND